MKPKYARKYKDGGTLAPDILASGIGAITPMLEPDAFSTKANSLKTVSSSLMNAAPGLLAIPGAGPFLAGGAVLGGAVASIVGNNVQKRDDSIAQAAQYRPNYMSYGGRMYAEGGAMPSMEQLTSIMSGGSHEQNPQGGVLVGQDAQGTPNLVEEGETILNSEQYVFSDRIEIEKEMAIEFALPRKFIGKSFAEASKLLAVPKGYESDLYSLSTSRKMMDRLMMAQEQIRGEMEAEQTQAPQGGNQFATGGFMDAGNLEPMPEEVPTGETPPAKYPKWYTPQTPEIEAMIDSMFGGDANLVRTIIEFEGGASFDKFTGQNKKGQILTNKTLREVYEEADRWVAAQRARGIPADQISSAAGAGQFIRETGTRWAKKAGLSLDDLFSPENQLLMIKAGLGELGIEKYRSGEMSEKEFSGKLAGTWAAFPKDETGVGSYTKGGQANVEYPIMSEALQQVRSTKGTADTKPKEGTAELSVEDIEEANKTTPKTSKQQPQAVYDPETGETRYTNPKDKPKEGTAELSVEDIEEANRVEEKETEKESKPYTRAVLDPITGETVYIQEPRQGKSDKDSIEELRKQEELYDIEELRKQEGLYDQEQRDLEELRKQEGLYDIEEQRKLEEQRKTWAGLNTPQGDISYKDWDPFLQPIDGVTTPPFSDRKRLLRDQQIPGSVDPEMLPGAYQNLQNGLITDTGVAEAPNVKRNWEDMVYPNAPKSRATGDSINSDKPHYMRYAPIAANLANMISTGIAGPETASPYLTNNRFEFNPVDMRHVEEMLRTEQRGLQNRLQNTRGNMGQSQQMNLSSSMPYFSALSEARLKSTMANNELLSRKSEFEYRQAAANNQAKFVTDDLNAKNRAAYDNAMRSYLAAMGEGIGGIGRENWMMEQANKIPGGGDNPAYTTLFRRLNKE